MARRPAAPWPWPQRRPCPTPRRQLRVPLGNTVWCAGAADYRAVREIEDALRIAERSGDDLALTYAQMALGLALVHRLNRCGA